MSRSEIKFFLKVEMPQIVGTKFDFLLTSLLLLFAGKIWICQAVHVFFLLEIQCGIFLLSSEVSVLIVLVLC